MNRKGNHLIHFRCKVKSHIHAKAPNTIKNKSSRSSKHIIGIEAIQDQAYLETPYFLFNDIGFHNK